MADPEQCLLITVVVYWSPSTVLVQVLGHNRTTTRSSSLGLSAVTYVPIIPRMRVVITVDSCGYRNPAPSYPVKILFHVATVEDTCDAGMQ